MNPIAWKHNYLHLRSAGFVYAAAQKISDFPLVNENAKGYAST
jgi:hypothetical protein